MWCAWPIDASLASRTSPGVVFLAGIVRWAVVNMATNEENPTGPRRGPRATPEREQAERLNLMVQSITDYAIFSLDVAGTVTSWNPAAEQVFGYSEAEIVGQSFAILFTPEDRQAGAPEAELELAARTGSSDDIRWHLCKDGHLVFVNGKVTPIRDGEDLLGFTKIAHDVTERKN